MLRVSHSGSQMLTLAQAGAVMSLLISAACGPAPLNVPLVATNSPAPLLLLPSAQVLKAGTAGPPRQEAATPTAGEFVLNLTPLATETALPTLALPTRSLFAGTFEVWDGSPTYPADSQPGFYFRLRYDPGTWALTTDQYGFPTLGHRSIAGCTITPTGGRGLPLNGTVNHEVRRINGVSFQVNTAYINGVRQFVTYVGGDGVIYTAFQVSFGDQVDQCLADAEAVLGSLKNVSIYEATPIPTP